MKQELFKQQESHTRRGLPSDKP